MTSTRQLPTGTVTFLFTDIEGSTRLLQELGDARYKNSLAEHDHIIRSAVTDAGGMVVHTIGDAFFAVFTDAGAALRAAATAQRLLGDHHWPHGVPLRVRIGIHTGAGILGGDDYVGLDVHRAARISAAAHGGQIVISAATAGLSSHSLPPGMSLRDLGAHRLKDLTRDEQLYQVDVAGLPHHFPALRSLDLPASLPQPPTSFVGRARELAHAAEYLGRARLLTLTGPGGTGKTRLAIELARAATSRYPDGVQFVALASIDDPEQVPSAILDALSVWTTAANVSPRDHLIRHLADKKMLLVLDNFEQILGAAALVADLMAAAPGVSLVVTSRAPLHLAGEQELPVPPLSLPDPECVTPEELAGFDSVQLFSQRAAAVRPDFSLNTANAASVAALAARLDGLPLAIELAASRVRLLTPEAILERLDNRLLANPAPDLPVRQQAMVNAIGWSYDLLDEPARRLFERLAVFVGDAGLSEIEAVCGGDEAVGDVLGGLGMLVDHSLVRQTGLSGDPRYRMLVVIQEFSHAALMARGEDDELRRRHAHAYAELARRAAPHLLTSRRAEWLDLLAADHENLRAAHDWAISTGSADLALDLAGDLWRYWQTRGHLADAGPRIDGALALPGSTPAARARALEARGGVAYWQGDGDRAHAAYEEALAIVRTNGDRRELANALYNASFPLALRGERDRAGRYLDESLALAEAGGDRLGIGRAYWARCNLASEKGDQDAVIANAERAAAEFEQLDAPFDLGWSWFMLGQAYYRKGDAVTARDYLTRGLPLFVSVNDLSAIVLFLSAAAAIAADDGRELEAARLLGAAERLKTDTGATISDTESNRYPLLEALSTSGDDRVRRAMEEGAAMSTDEVVALATALHPHTSAR